MSNPWKPVRKTLTYAQWAYLKAAQKLPMKQQRRAQIRPPLRVYSSLL